MFNILRSSASCRLPEHGSLSTDSRPSLKHLCHTFTCAALSALFPKAFWIDQIVSAQKCSSLTRNLMQTHCSTHSVFFMTATQYTCSLNGVHHPHWLVQWSHHCSCMLIPVHSPWLPGYIDFEQTVLVILTMAGLFPTYSIIYLSIYHLSIYLSIYLSIIYLYLYTHTYICI